MIEIFIVDDHPLIRRGLEYLVQSSPDICVCGEAADGFSALDAIPSANPDALVLDIVMPGMSGMDVLKQLRSRRIPENCIGNKKKAHFDFEVRFTIRLYLAYSTCLPSML